MLWDRPNGAICPICPIALSMLATVLLPLHCPFALLGPALVTVTVPATDADTGEPRSPTSLAGDTEDDRCRMWWLLLLLLFWIALVMISPAEEDTGTLDNGDELISVE